MKNFAAKYFICVIFIFMALAFGALAYTKIDKFISQEEIKQEIKINWRELYPFIGDDAPEIEANENLNIFEKINKYIHDKLELYTTEKIFCYGALVENARRFEDLINWNMVQLQEYNNVIKMPDGYLTTLFPRGDVNKIAESVINFSEYCNENNIKLIYVSAPFKVCKHDDKNISGVLDFSNYNADDFHEILNKNAVINIDLREILHAENKKHHEMFYRTDHHWKSETGLWASQIILKFLQDKFNWDINYKMLDTENFKFVNYPKLFLGSQGKKLTLARTEPDDFTMIYPKFETKFIYNDVALTYNSSGDISIMYFMEHVNKKDYYNINTYCAYINGDRPLIQIENLKSDNNKKILFIHDSFGDCVVPFLSIGTKYHDSVDLRAFKGSLKNFISHNKPDAIIILYNTSALNGQNTSSEFDFR